MLQDYQGRCWHERDLLLAAAKTKPVAMDEEEQGDVRDLPNPRGSTAAQPHTPRAGRAPLLCFAGHTKPKGY